MFECSCDATIEILNTIPNRAEIVNFAMEVGRARGYVIDKVDDVVILGDEIVFHFAEENGDDYEHSGSVDLSLRDIISDFENYKIKVWRDETVQ